MKMQTIRLEDKEEYIVLEQLYINETKYVYLALKDELENEDVKILTIVIRKFDKKEKYILSLDTKEEYKQALVFYLNKKNESKN